MWDWLKEISLRTFWNKVSDAASSEDPAAEEESRSRAAATAPIIWLSARPVLARPPLSQRSAVTAVQKSETASVLARGSHRSTTGLLTRRSCDCWIPAGWGGRLRASGRHRLRRGRAHVLLVVMAINDPNEQEVVKAVESTPSSSP